MEQVHLQFLGTSNAVPTQLRNHTAIALSFRDELILVDCGEGTQRQFRFAKLSPCKITRLLITHWHGDHVLGIPGLLQTLAMSDYSKTLHIYGPAGTQKLFGAIDQLMLGYKVNIKLHEVSNGVIVDEKDFFIESKSMDHGIPCNAYSFVVKDRRRINKSKIKKFKLSPSPLFKELVSGKDISVEGKTIHAKDVTYLDKGKKICFILDTGMTESAVELASDSDLLICEATFSSVEAEQAKAYQHLTAADAAKIAKKAKVGLLLLTHISQRYEHNTKIIEKESKKIFKKTRLVHDLEKVTL